MDQLKAYNPVGLKLGEMTSAAAVFQLPLELVDGRGIKVPGWIGFHLAKSADGLTLATKAEAGADPAIKSGGTGLVLIETDTATGTADVGISGKAFFDDGVCDLQLTVVDQATDPLYAVFHLPNGEVLISEAMAYSSA